MKSLGGITLINNDLVSRSLRVTVLTPAKEGGEAPAHGVDPGNRQDAKGFPARHHPQRGQRPGDHHVPIQRNHHQCHHTADTKQRAAEGIQLATCVWRGEVGRGNIFLHVVKDCSFQDKIHFLAAVSSAIEQQLQPIRQFPRSLECMFCSCHIRKHTRLC